MSSLPAGIVTFLLTSIESDPAAWERDSARYDAALDAHDRLAAEAIARCDGVLLKRRGEEGSLFAVFSRTSDAVHAALDLQRALQSQDEACPFGVRMALNTGEAELRDRDYFGTVVNRAARMRSLAHGGQILLTHAAQEMARDSLPEGAELVTLGIHRLRDLSRPEEVFQLCHPQITRRFPPLASLDSFPNNLPAATSSFVGRDCEVAEARRLLAATRLLTLTGAAGCGKTRLALQAAAESLDQFPGGVWLVELTALRDGQHIPAAIAAAIGAREAPGESVLDAVTTHLRDFRSLLILDNCEHLVAECAGFAGLILRRCPRVSLLATSREILYIAGETSWRVPSLALPAASGCSIEATSQAPAVRLFVERAAAACGEFRLTERTAPVVAEICRRLDGIPLAIELAAARTRALSLPQIAARLDDRFLLLTGGSRTAIPRHQTLKAAVDWSYDLLSPAERGLLCRLGAFSGGWTLELAESMLSNDASEDAPPALDALDLLTQLVDKSLVTAEDQGEDTRYRLSETIRQYGTERLQEAGHAAQTRDAHAAALLQLAELAEPAMMGAEQRAALGRLEMDQDNLRAAMDWQRARGSDPDAADSALRFIAAIWRYWLLRGRLTEGAEWCDSILQLPEAARADPWALARALNGAGAIAWRLGDTAAAQLRYERSLALREAMGDRQGIANSLNNLGLIARERGDLNGALERFRQGLALQEQLGNLWGQAMALNNITSACIELRQLDDAGECIERCLPLWKLLGDQGGLAVCLNSQGNRARLLGRHADAAKAFHAALTIHRDLGDRPAMIESITSIAHSAASCRMPTEAVRLISAAQEARQTYGVPANPQDAAEEERVLAELQEMSGSLRYCTDRQQGAALSLEQACGEALALMPAQAGNGG